MTCECVVRFCFVPHWSRMYSSWNIHYYIDRLWLDADNSKFICSLATNCWVGWLDRWRTERLTNEWVMGLNSGSNNGRRCLVLTYDWRMRLNLVMVEVEQQLEVITRLTREVTAGEKTRTMEDAYWANETCFCSRDGLLYWFKLWTLLWPDSSMTTESARPVAHSVWTSVFLAEWLFFSFWPVRRHLLPASSSSCLSGSFLYQVCACGWRDKQWILQTHLWRSSVDPFRSVKGSQHPWLEEHSSPFRFMFVALKKLLWCLKLLGQPGCYG